VFSLPCALQGGAETVLAQVGIRTDLIDEIEASYANLFNPQTPSTVHRHLGAFTGLRYWCWCLGCACQRLRAQELRKMNGKKPSGQTRRQTGRVVRYDRVLQTLMESKATPWHRTEFRRLWPRILALEAHLQAARPWNFWVLFRDRRDTVQYWTFLFGTLVLALTVASVALAAAQVVGAFKSTSS